MKRRRTMFFIFFLVLLSGAGIFVFSFSVMNRQKRTLVISHYSGIYDESIDISVRTFIPGTIYYIMTGEGSESEAENIPANGTFVEYEGPFHLELQESTSVYSFQFYCEFDDGTISEIYERDYILDARGNERFSTTYIVSISGNEEKLFGYEEGIFVRGRQFDEYMAENPDVNLLNTIIPANYLSDAELPVNVAVFLQDGTQIIDQKCGLKIYGNVTRAKNQKSFRLISRYVYDTVNEFSYEFLPNLISDETNMAIDAFQRLSFHSSGNDNGYAFIRTALIGELARRSGFPDVLVSESATVYVNGKYLGVYWLQNTYDDRYFKEKYGNYEGEMVVCEGTLSGMSAEEAETEIEIQCVREYNEFCNWASTADMTDEDNWRHVCETIDVENFASYVAIEYYIGNIDWPHNNVKVYRYMGGAQDKDNEGTVFDGRYRYLLFDTDYGLGLKFLGWYGMDETEERLEALCQYTEASVLFGSLLDREEFRNLFVSSVLHLINGSFSGPAVFEALGEYNGKRLEELRYMMEETTLLKNSLWESDDNNMGNVEEEMAEILRFAENRPSTVLSEMQSVLGCGQIVSLSIVSDSGSGYSIGGLKVGGPVYEGLCYANIPMEIRCETGPGLTVVGYYINSEYVEGEKLELLPLEWLNGADSVFVEPVFETELTESLEISAYHIQGGEDYVILKNNGQIPVLLSDYALTDSEEKWSKGRLPGVKLETGEEYVVYGEKYSGKMEKNSVRVPFSWNSEEEIVLIHESEGILERRNISH